MASGDYIHANSGTTSATVTADAQDVDNAEVITAGAKYVSGDITMAIGYVDGEAKDTATFGDAGSNGDAYDSMSASVDYAVASGVTATIGYTSVDSSDEASADTANSGSSWYIGTNVSF